MFKRITIIFLAGIPLLCLCAGLIYFLPPVNQRLAWRVDNLRIQVRRALNPPEQVVFVPQEQQDQIAAVVEATLRALTPSPFPTATPTLPGPTETPQPSATATLEPTAIPPQALLQGIRHEYQKFNNCGPANLSMALSFWGWQGDQRETAAFLRPGEFDKNVMPAEMEAFVEQKTDLAALVRFGGELDMLKRLIAAGFPVVIEKGYDPPDDDWMGHYLTLNGFDDTQGRFTAQDSLIMPNYPLPYEQVEQRWRDFNRVYLVIYPPEREAEVLSILGPQADETHNYQYAAQKAEQEIGEQTGRDQYFAWFNLGTSRAALGDYAGAAEAYDQAFALYPSLPEDERPWRVLWYEAGPYAAYYHTGRFQDVVNLANTTFFALGEYTLEESFYWRGLANEALGDHDTALFDLRKAVELNPNFTQAGEQLARLEAGSP
jgi:tetratricopeptide (TPR) repeat protein